MLIAMVCPAVVPGRQTCATASRCAIHPATTTASMARMAMKAKAMVVKRNWTYDKCKCMAIPDQPNSQIAIGSHRSDRTVVMEV